MNANNINVVWHEFTEFLVRHVKPDEVGILVAYKGETCDLRWLWKITQAPNSALLIPPNINYFLDPLHTIAKYSRCKYNLDKSKLVSLSLGCVYKFIKGGSLNGAHNSLVDVQAQTAVVTHQYFLPFIDCTHSIREVQGIHLIPKYSLSASGIFWSDYNSGWSPIGPTIYFLRNTY